MHDTDQLVAALQLLLGDYPQDTRQSVIFQAFPDDYLLPSSSHREARRLALILDDHLLAARGIANGDSGLGIVVVMGLRERLAQASARATRIKQLLIGDRL